MIIKLSQDRKVQGVKGERNSFGLPAIKSCPGATEECKAVCYATRGMFTFKAAKELYADNYKSLRMLLAMGDNQAACFLYNEIIKHNKSGLFRWNIGGDIFSLDYFKTIIKVANMAPSITFWIYTRSFDVLLEYRNTITTSKIPYIPNNLKINLSFDRDNIRDNFVNRNRTKIPYSNNLIHVLDNMIYTITFMGNINLAKSMFPNRRWITCPETSGKIELQSACANCKLCFGPYNKLHARQWLDLDEMSKAGMPYTTKDIMDTLYYGNKDYGSKIGIHFPTNKEEGRK